MTPTEALSAYCDAFARREPQAIAALLATDAVFDIPFQERRLEGRDLIMREMATSIRGLKNITVQLGHVIEGDNDVYAEGVFLSEMIGAPAKVDGTPMRTDFRFVAVVEMKDGLIVRLSEYFDTKPLKPQERARVYTSNRRSPYWEGVERAGVSEFMTYNNTYFPMIYHHAPVEEYAALIDRVTMWDVGCERQTQFKGPDALAFADYLATRKLTDMSVGACRYTHVCDAQGQIMSDPVVLRPFQDTVWFSHGNTDLTLWGRGIAHGGDWDVEVSEPDVAPIQIQGPRSLDMLRGLVTPALDDLKFYRCRPAEIAGIAAIVSQTGWSGGAGYEIFPLSSDRAMALWDALLEAGRPYDLMVTGPNVNRAVERGVTDTCYLSNSGMNPYEAGEGRLVDLDKGDFIGREALARIHRDGPKRQTVGLLFDDTLPRIEWNWPLADPRGRPGEVRWATHSFALGRDIAIALVDKDVAPGETVAVTHPKGTSRAEVTTIPFVDR
jgi:glycine cleavage system aminomethyltransferase T/ketosteroid isomerase-like protein